MMQTPVYYLPEQKITHSSLNLIYFSIPLHLSFLLDIKWLNFLRKNFLDLKILCENSTGSGASGTNWLADY